MDLGKNSIDELKQISQNLLQHVTPRDLTTLLFPPAMGIDVLQGLLSDTPFEEKGFDPAYPEPALLEAVLETARWLSTKYFKTTIRDVDVLNADTPVLLVGNHSGGLMPLDALFAINEIREKVSSTAVIHPLVHDFAYTAPRIASLAKRMGILRAKSENALDALNAGRSVLVYPGGDEDAFRTFSERNRIVLAGRKGFIRLAMKAGVPIVPLISVGLQESFMILTKGRKLAKKLGIKKWLRTEIFPVALSFPWGLTSAFTPYLPLPTAIDMRFLAPIHLDGSPNDEHAVACAYDHIYDVMQTAMDDMAENRVPFFGR